MRIHAFSALSVSLIAAGCAATPLPEVQSSFRPADPSVGSRHAHYSPVLGGYTPRKPVGPKSWRELNDQLSPANSEVGS